MSLQQAKLQQRNKELDAREEYLDAKLKVLEEAPITLKVYEARVKAFETKLSDIQDEIKGVENDLAIKQNEYTILLRTYAELRNTLDIKESDKEEVKSKTIQLRKELTHIKEEIHLQTNYYKEQQILIDGYIEAGNEKILDLSYQYSTLEKQIQSLKEEKTVLRHDLDEDIFNNSCLKNDLDADIISKIYVFGVEILYNQEVFPTKQYMFFDIYRDFLNYHLRGIVSAKGLKYLEEHNLFKG